MFLPRAAGHFLLKGVPIATQKSIYKKNNENSFQFSKSLLYVVVWSLPFMYEKEYRANVHHGSFHRPSAACPNFQLQIRVMAHLRWL